MSDTIYFHVYSKQDLVLAADTWTMLVSSVKAPEAIAWIATGRYTWRQLAPVYIEQISMITGRKRYLLATEMLSSITSTWSSAVYPATIVETSSRQTVLQRGRSDPEGQPRPSASRRPQ